MSEENKTIIELVKKMSALEERITYINDKVTDLSKRVINLENQVAEQKALLMRIVMNQDKLIKWVTISLIIIIAAVLGVKIPLKPA